MEQARYSLDLREFTFQVQAPYYFNWFNWFFTVMCVFRVVIEKAWEVALL